MYTLKIKSCNCKVECTWGEGRPRIPCDQHAPELLRHTSHKAKPGVQLIWGNTSFHSATSRTRPLMKSLAFYTYRERGGGRGREGERESETGLKSRCRATISRAHFITIPPGTEERKITPSTSAGPLGPPGSASSREIRAKNKTKQKVKKKQKNCRVKHNKEASRC